MVERENLQIDYWSLEKREQVASRIDGDIFDLQKKERMFREMELLDLRVFEEIDIDVGRLCQIKELILSADSEFLEANRERYKIYLGNYGADS